ncbi:MAG: hypothetical protein ACPLVI_08435, partial [Thermoplasmata archaeon]
LTNFEKYNITFFESGLPAGTKWFVNLSNGQSFNSTGNTIFFNEPNGSYSYIIASAQPNYAPIPESGNFTVNGCNISENIIFKILAEFPITFIENGLPSGSTWYVNLTNGEKFITSGKEISFQLPNGSYGYSAYSELAGYSANPSSGFVNVMGGPVTINITFIPCPVIENVSYISASQMQIIAIYGNNFGTTPKLIKLSDGSVDTIYSNNTPSLAIWDLTEGWEAGASGISANNTTNGIGVYLLNWSNQEIILSGFGSALGTNHTKSLNIAPGDTIKIYVYGDQSKYSVYHTEVNNYEQTYLITFRERGLPVNTNWSVNFSGKSIISNQSKIFFAELNGTYSYKIGLINDYSASPYSGTIEINGTNVTQMVTFTLISIKKYSVIFTEIGLPAGATWSVTLNGTTLSSTNGSITFHEPNGTYSFSIGSISGYTSFPSSGSITVNGDNVNETITFTALTYTITFIESGLSSGTTWYVTLNGITKSSSNNTITFNEPNGTYSYTVATGNKEYAPTQYSGSFTV